MAADRCPVLEGKTMKLPKKLMDWPWKIVTHHTSFRTEKGPFNTRRMTYSDGGKQIFWIGGNSKEYPSLLELLQAQGAPDIKNYLLEVIK